jgi:hypothetical protein
VTSTTPPQSIGYHFQTLLCPSGQVATSGGFSSNPPGVPEVFVTQNQPAGAPGTAPFGWTVGDYNNSGSTTLTLTIYAVCATP